MKGLEMMLLLACDHDIFHLIVRKPYVSVP
jgi:hypothetical protein